MQLASVPFPYEVAYVAEIGIKLPFLITYYFENKFGGVKANFAKKVENFMFFGKIIAACNNIE